MRHATRLLLSAELARDVVQESWISIARGLRRLDDPGRFPAWCFAIVTRRAADQLRSLLRERRLRDAAATLPATVGGEPIDSRLDLHAALLRLPFDQRLMVSLHYGEGLTIEEIAATHALPPGTVKSRLFAARQALKTLLEGDDDDPS